MRVTFGLLPKVRPGDIQIATGRLRVQGGAIIDSSTFGSGPGGTVEVHGFAGADTPADTLRSLGRVAVSSRRR